MRTSELRNRTLLRPTIGTLVFKAIAFDYSGLLFNDLFFTLFIVNQALREFSCPRMTLAELRREFGFPLEPMFIRRGMPKHIARTRPFQIYRQRYPEYRNLIRPFPDTIECIRTLSSLGVKLAIVSQTPRKQMEDQLGRFGLLKYFRPIIAKGDLPREKPDPLPLFEVARQLGVSTKDLLMVGDMTEDRECARRAGAISAAVDRAGSYHTRSMLADAKPDFLVQSLQELANIIAARRIEVPA